MMMLGSHRAGLTRYKGSGSGGQATAYTYTNAEAAAVAARMTTAPSNAYAALVDNFFTAIKASPSILAVADGIYFRAAETQQAALLNWVGSYATSTLVGTPAFTADRGFTGSPSSDAYVSTGLAANRSGNKYTQNSATIAVWNLANISSGSPAVGFNAGYVKLNPCTGGNCQISINDYSPLSYASTSALGFFAATRTGPAARQMYIDVNQVASDTQGSSGLDASNFLEDTGTTQYPDAWQLGFSFYGGALTSTQIATLRNAVYALLHGVNAV